MICARFQKIVLDQHNSRMKITFITLFVLFFLTSCQDEQKDHFSSKSLAQKVYNTEMQKNDVQNVLDAHLGEKVIIEIWASWCGDCIKSLPEVAEFQSKNPDIPFIFFSVDDTEEQWRNGLAKHMDKFEIQGEQYFFNTGWNKNGENEFIEYIQLNWIPRFLLLDEKGNIEVFNAKKINSNRLQNQLNIK